MSNLRNDTDSEKQTSICKSIKVGDPWAISSQASSKSWMKVGCPGKPCPAHPCPSCCAVGKEKLSPCSPARADTGSQPGAGHQLRAWSVHTLVSPGLVYTEIHTSDAFPFFSGSREAARAGGASQGIPSTARSTNTAEMHLNLIKFFPPLLLPTASSKSSSLRADGFNLPVPDWKGAAGLEGSLLCNILPQNVATTVSVKQKWENVDGRCCPIFPDLMRCM